MQTTLLVEDAAFFEKAIVKKLHEVGRHQIMVARSYEEAENCLNLPIGEPDLALVDLTLPDAPTAKSSIFARSGISPRSFSPAASTRKPEASSWKKALLTTS